MCVGKGVLRGGVVTELVSLNPSEHVVFNSRRLRELCSEYGVRGAEAVVMDAVEDISGSLFVIETAYKRDRVAEIPAMAKHVSQLAADIGMLSLARVARDLGIVAQRGDIIACRAVWARVVRIGDQSLAKVWQAPEMSM